MSDDKMLLIPESFLNDVVRWTGEAETALWDGDEDDRDVVDNWLGQIRCDANQHIEKAHAVQDEVRDDVEIVVDGCTIRVLLDGEPVFEYVHPEPGKLLPSITIGPVRQEHDRPKEISIFWGHGWGWCDATGQFTRLVSRKLAGAK